MWRKVLERAERVQAVAIVLSVAAVGCGEPAAKEPGATLPVAAAAIAAAPVRAEAVVERPTGEVLLGAPVYETEQLSDVTFTVDRIYKSMEGPSTVQALAVGPVPGRLLWIVSARMDAVDPEGRVLASQENLCHAQIRSAHQGSGWEAHNRRLFGGNRSLPSKWFTLIAGRFSIAFPEGFGIPLYSGEPLETFQMILNLDPNADPFDLRVRTRLRYVYDDELERPFTALSKTGAQAGVFVDAVDGARGEEHAEDCSLDDGDHITSTGRSAKQSEGRTSLLDGREISFHFMVAPGSHVYRTPWRLSGLPKGVDRVTVHYMAAHLHVYGSSVELFDKTAGRTVLASRATANEKHTGLLDMSEYSSPDGVVLHRDHEYEIVAVYDNTSPRAIDAMAVMYIYYADPLFNATAMDSVRRYGRAAIATAGELFAAVVGD